MQGSVLREFAGQWVVWNRQQDRVISSGRTFDEAKLAAAAAGEKAVVLTKASRRGSLHPHWLCTVAVFVALDTAASAVKSQSVSQPWAFQRYLP